MKKIVLGTFALFYSSFLFGQNDSTKIETYTSFLGYQYVQNDNTLLMPIELLEIFENHPVAFEKMKKARSRRLASQLFYSAGVVAIGFTIVAGVTQKSFAWETASAGAALIIAGIPLSRSYHKHTQAATALFNETLVAPKASMQLQFGFDRNGLGLQLRF